MATPFEPCDRCGQMIASQNPPLRVRIQVGTLPGTVDLDADELEFEVADGGLPEWLHALFDTTPGIGGAAVTLCVPCVQAKMIVSADEVDRLKDRSARTLERGRP